MMKKFVVILFVFLQIAFAAAQPIISSVQENPNQVYYGEQVEVTASITSTESIDKVILHVDGIDYQMTETTPNQYTISLHTIKNLATLGFAVYPYTITVKDSLGNTVTYTDSIEIIAIEEGTILSQSEVQALFDWIRRWI